MAKRKLLLIEEAEGLQVDVTVTVRGQQILDRAADLLERVGRLPCQHRGNALETASAIVKLRAGMTRMQSETGGET